jgi:nucleoside-diphosphate-sugar epimerase
LSNETGFEPTWSVRDGINDLVERFTERSRQQYALD